MDLRWFCYTPDWHIATLLLLLAVLGAYVGAGIARLRGTRRAGILQWIALAVLVVLNGLGLASSIDVTHTMLDRATIDVQAARATRAGEQFDPGRDLTHSVGDALDTWWATPHIQNVWVADLMMLGAWLVLMAASREYWRNAWRQIRHRRLAMVCFGILVCYGLVALLDSLSWQDAGEDEQPDGSTVMATIDAPPPLSQSQVASDATGNMQRVHARKAQWAGMPELEPVAKTLLVRVCEAINLYRPPKEWEETYSAPLAGRLYKRKPEAVMRTATRSLDVAVDADGVAAAREAATAMVEAATTAIHTDVDEAAAIHPQLSLQIAVPGRPDPVIVDTGATLAAADSLRKRVAMQLHQPDAPAGLRIIGVGAQTVGRIDFPKLRHPHSHLLGTNEAGQDVLFLSLRGVRTALIIGCVTTLIAIPFAMLFGIVAGWFGGWIDDLITWLYAVLGNIPSVLLIAAVILLFGQGLFQLCIVMGVTSWVGLCRLLRGETLKLREMEYVQAARAFGVRTSRILMRHVVPNVMHIVLISFILRFSGLVLAEAVLSYLGIGVGSDTGSWGNMINQAIGELAREPVVWWSFASAMVFMLVLVLAANIFGDAVRDALDPRLRTR